jgi:polysaccharide export outer membrane protein
MKSFNPKIFLIAIALLVVLSSCNKKAQLLYFNNISNQDLKTTKIPEYTLKQGDVLYIQIITQDPTVSSLFNNRGLGNAMQSTMFGNDASNYLYGYSISDSGIIRLPVLGKLKIADMTINQCRDLIQKQTEIYLKDGIAVVKLLSFKLTVLGEVKSPGVKTNLKDNLTIFEGIGLAGDLTDFAERTNVLLMRQTPDGIKTIRVNLQDKNLLFSEAYYLVPNDILVVEPRKGKLFNMNAPNISISLSILTTALLLLSYILK